VTSVRAGTSVTGDWDWAGPVSGARGGWIISDVTTLYRDMVGWPVSRTVVIDTSVGVS
jgi:hypothetical protein